MPGQPGRSRAARRSSPSPYEPSGAGARQRHGRFPTLVYADPVGGPRRRRDLKSCCGNRSSHVIRQMAVRGRRPLGRPRTSFGRSSAASSGQIRPSPDPAAPARWPAISSRSGMQAPSRWLVCRQGRRFTGAKRSDQGGEGGGGEGGVKRNGRGAVAADADRPDTIGRLGGMDDRQRQRLGVVAERQSCGDVRRDVVSGPNQRKSARAAGRGGSSPTARLSDRGVGRQFRRGLGRLHTAALLPVHGPISPALSVW